MKSNYPNWIMSVVLGCLLLSSRASAQSAIQVYISSPGAGALVADKLNVAVNTISTYEIQSVTATVADRVTNLVYTINVGWTGSLSLVGLARGPQTLLVKAVDAFGNSAQVQLSFIYDRPPVFTVLEPSFETFARPQVRVRATATDDDPVGTVIRVYRFSYRSSTLLATVTTNLDQNVDLSPWDGGQVDMEFDATDSAGQTTTIHRFVDVVANTNVVEVDRVSGGISDVSADAILFIDGSLLKSKSRLSGVETTLFDSQVLPLTEARLTSHGAIFATGPDLYEVRDGTVIDLGPYQDNLVVKGNFAIWIAEGQTLMFRDLLAGTNVVVSATAGNWNNDVADNGDVVYWGGNDYQVYRYRNGSSSHLASGIYPRTDGLNVTYFAGGNLALFDGTNELILGPADHLAGIYPVLRGGWTAFSKPGNGQNQIWTRSPSGIQSQRTFFGVSSYLSDMGTNGDLMVVPSGYRLYYLSGSLPPEDFGPWSWTAFWRQGNWYAVLGRSLVALMTMPNFTISSPGWTTNGQFTFTVSVETGSQVVTQESTNLLDWVNVSTNQISGTSTVTVPTTGFAEKKFYRVMSVP